MKHKFNVNFTFQNESIDENIIIAYIPARHIHYTCTNSTRIVAEHNENDLEGKFSLYRQPEKRTFSFLHLFVFVCVFDLYMYFGSSSSSVAELLPGNMRGV